MFYRRVLEDTIRDVSSNFPVLLLTGPRQVGKTTLLKHIAGENRTYVTLDDPVLRNLAKTEPSLFLQRFKAPVLIDEIQYAPELLPYIKMIVDEKGQTNLFWLTGSQMFHLMQDVTESLAGRVGILQMQGLSYSEISNRLKPPFLPEPDQLYSRIDEAAPLDLKGIFEYIHKGAMPALYERQQDIELYYASYVSTYVQRDIRDLKQIGDEQAFLRFLSACAARTGQMLNYTALANEVGISSPTAKTWLSILVTSGLVLLIEPYYNNALKRIIKSPMMYFMDTGLCAYLTRWTSPEALEAGAMSGSFFETFVVAEIVKSYLNAGKRPPVFYYRDKDQKEIDLIVEQNNVLYPIEIKKSGNPKRNAVRHFSVLQKTGKTIGPGAVVCLCRDLLPLDSENNMVPAWMI